LKAKKENISVRELFKQKLEYNEVIPDVAVKSKLMRRVARQEFLRFNTGSFNIYYLGGLLLAGLAAALLFLPGSERGQAVISPVKTDTSSFIDLRSSEALKSESGKTVEIHSEPIKNITTKQNPVSSDSQTDKQNIRQQNHVAAPQSIKNSLPKNGIFSSEINKLRGSLRTENAFILPLNTEGCAPLKVRFTNGFTSYDSCRWTFGDGGSSNKKEPEWIFDVEGEYKVELQVFTSDGRTMNSFATVTVHPRPQAHFEISPINAALPGDEIKFRNYSTNATRFKWDFGDGGTSDYFEPDHSYLKYSKYNVRLTVWSDWGCSDSLTVLNAFSGSQFFVEFPNAFIPNQLGPSGGYYSSKSDEAAQVFHPSFSGVTEYQLKIFSKLGVTIFESYDINLGWDGYNKGQLCDPGVYIWKVRGKYRNGEPFIKMGDVTLLQN
jgi:PKD repeat protein